MSEQTNKMGTAPEETKNDVILTKMTVKGIGCLPTGGDPKNPAKPNELCVIAGRAEQIKLGEDANGRVFSVLLGSFYGKNLHTGVGYRASKLFLPGGIHEAVELPLKELDGKGFVKFALRIQSVAASNPIGYSYQAVSLIPMSSQTDEIGDLVLLANPPSPAALPPASVPAEPAHKSGAKK